jgi:hypothetical protein
MGENKLTKDGEDSRRRRSRRRKREGPKDKLDKPADSHYYITTLIARA